MGVLSREKQPLEQLHSKNEGWLVFEGGPIFKRFAVLHYGRYTGLLRVGLFLGLPKSKWFSNLFVLSS